MNTIDKLNNTLGYLTAMSFDRPELSNDLVEPLNTLSEAISEVENLSLSGVVDSKRFTDTDLLNGYQAGCIEGLDDCCDLGLDDLKEIKEDGKKWVKRYTEQLIIYNYL